MMIRDLSGSGSKYMIDNRFISHTRKRVKGCSQKFKEKRKAINNIKQKQNR